MNIFSIYNIIVIRILKEKLILFTLIFIFFSIKTNGRIDLAYVKLILLKI